VKLDKTRNLNKELKFKINKLNDNLKMANTKIDFLQNQLISTNVNANLTEASVETEGNNVCYTETNNNNIIISHNGENVGYNTIEYENAKSQY